MSRSRRKTPICGIGADSDKVFKKQEHSRFRCMTRRSLHRALLDLDADAVFPHPKEVGNPWASDKDGKMYFGPMSPHCQDYWAEMYPVLMRK